MHAQSCSTICNPMNCSLPGSSVYRIHQARILEWVAISSSRGSSQPKDQTCINRWIFFLPLPPPGKPKSFAKYLWHKVKVKVKSLSRVRLFVTPWTVAYQAPLSIGFSRQEYWSGLPFSSPGDLPDPGIEPRSPAL